MFVRTPVLILSVGLFVSVGTGLRPSVADETKSVEVQFNRDIRPILSENCFQCHGPDVHQRQAELRLDSREGATAEHDGGRAIVAGDIKSSRLMQRILSTVADERMPPEKTGRKLTAQQIELLRRWIEQGAKYEKHWSLLPPQRAELPRVKDAAWPKNPIDRFILARLDKEGLVPSPEADKGTLLRRVSLDLTGLPPTPEERAAFLADDSPLAYEKVVDRLLNSPRYGERMAMHWLDLARYADTNGYNNDEDRTQWMWRDWVIESFNRNQPYDEFITEQLAGDLLPGATNSQKIATAFNRNHVLTTEGGIIDEEYRVEYVADRVHTTATVFLGLSMQCARCHDHKFDPLTQRDYYSFFAFFNNIEEKTVGYNAAKVAEPFVKVPTRDQQAMLDKLATRKLELEKKKTERAVAIDADLEKWEREILAAGKLPQSPLGLAHSFPLDEGKGKQIADAVDASRSGMVEGNAKWEGGKIGGALEFDGQTFVPLGETGSVEHDGPFSFSAWVFLTSNEPSTVLSKMDEANAFRGYDLIIEQGRIATHIVHHWPDNGMKVIAKEPISLNAWHHVAVTYDGKAKASGIAIYVDGKSQPTEITTDTLSGKDTIKTDKPFHLGRRTSSAPFRGKLDEVQIYRAALSADEVADLAKGQTPAGGIADLLKSPPAERSAVQRDLLKKYFVDLVDPVSRALATELGKVTKEKAELEKTFPATMVMQEMPAPRPAFVLNRGQYDQPGAAVSAAIPASLPPLPGGSPANRLGLAKWLVEPNHPLTARVAVNRWWQLYFGTGIVETVEDFGSQGAWPSHPDLLDWLATEFIRTGWNVKEMQRLIVTSATYRQASRVTPALLERDPKNRLLARGPRFRLPAETVRDNALALSGLLKEKIGGPSVKPYQPDGLWQDVSVERRAVYKQDEGDGLYRRSMYTFWKRTCPPPGMMTFDAPDRETCTIRRARTNTPLQALVLMNDPTYLEASRKLAERILKGGNKDDERLTQLFRIVLCRDPHEIEASALLPLFNKARERFQAAPDKARQLLKIGSSPRDEKLDATDLAAWTTLCSLVLNLDEAITKE